jgi:hypothetical protein
VARIYDPGAVAAQIKSALLGQYGQTSADARKGMMRPRVRTIFDLLKNNVPALADEGSEFAVTLPDIPGGLFPEQFRYMTEASMTVTVTAANYADGRWGY